MYTIVNNNVYVIFNRGKINELEWRQLLTGGVTSCIPDDKPNCDWLTDRAWAEIVALSDLPTFKGLAQHFKAHVRMA